MKLYPSIDIESRVTNRELSTHLDNRQLLEFLKLLQEISFAFAKTLIVMLYDELGTWMEGLGMNDNDLLCILVEERKKEIDIEVEGKIYIERNKKRIR